MNKRIADKKPSLRGRGNGCCQNAVSNKRICAVKCKCGLMRNKASK